jgi:hypothetical protein
MGRASGNPDDTFTVTGSGFSPQAPVTVSLTWNAPPQAGSDKSDRTASVKPRAARNGTFHFTVNQLFPHAVQLGQFTVVVTAPNGHKATTEFIVLPQIADPG